MGDERPTEIAFRDVIFLALLGFVVIVILLLAHINVPKEDAEVSAPGVIVVHIEWPAGLDTDVDLWVAAPMRRAVGYSNKAGPIFNLLRDDLGSSMDAAGANFEFAYSRSSPPGEYTINAHLFSDRSGALPIHVWLTVTMVKSGVEQPIGKAEIDLHQHGDEITMLRWTLDERGHVVPGSLNNLHRDLRSVK